MRLPPPVLERTRRIREKEVPDAGISIRARPVHLLSAARRQRTGQLRLPRRPGTRLRVVAVFMDIQPINPGHMLVVPNEHAPLMADLDAETAAHLMRVAHRLTAALRAAGLRCEGVNLFLADG